MNRVSIVMLGAVLSLAGCSGPNAYRQVAVDRDLGRADLERYDKEMQAAHAAGQHEGGRIEYSSNWPVGILIYWRRGEVMLSHGEPAEYHVRETCGIGPLSLLYVSEAHAAYRPTGERMSTMTTWSVLWGHLIMVHDNDVILPDGHRQVSSSSHWLHHLINFHSMDGHTTFSLFSIPNLVGVDSHQ